MLKEVNSHHQSVSKPPGQRQSNRASVINMQTTLQSWGNTQAVVHGAREVGSSCPNHCSAAADAGRGVSLEAACLEPVRAGMGLGDSVWSRSAWLGQGTDTRLG